MIWYVAQNGQAQKMSEEVLLYKIENDEISPDTLVVNPDIKNWIPLNQTSLWKNRITSDLSLTISNEIRNPLPVKTTIKQYDFKFISLVSMIILLILVVVTVLLLNPTNDKPFEVKDIKLDRQEIPYDSLKSEEFFDDYLKPLMLQVGFEDAYCGETKYTSSKEQYRDGSLKQNESVTIGRFEIPNSRYVLGFTYKIGWISEGNHNSVAGGITIGSSYYYLYFNLNQKTESFDGNGGEAYGTEILSDFDAFSPKDVGTGTFSGHDPTARIFATPKTNIEIYEKLKEYFEQPNIKEKLLIERQVN